MLFVVVDDGNTLHNRIYKEILGKIFHARWKSINQLIINSNTHTSYVSDVYM